MRILILLYMIQLTPPAQQTGWDVLKDVFFNAPLESADSSVFDFFHNDSNFRYEEKKGDWDLSYGGVTYTQWLQSFYFPHHPLVGDSFDTGRVLFSTSDFPGTDETFEIILELQYLDIDDCREAYAVLSKKLSALTGTTVQCHINEFKGLRKVFVTFRKETRRQIPNYELELINAGEVF